MMEQLAERRMQREEEAQFAANGLASSALPNSHGHNHEPLPDDEDDFDEEEYDSQDEDYDDEDDEPVSRLQKLHVQISYMLISFVKDTMTEEQRMEEGRRMFQIFAARMFEQRVLTAYREKVARERQQKLLEELEEESRLDEVREAKKARDAQKKKDKKKQQQLAKAEEKARKEAEKAAEEAAAKAAEERKQEEQRKKKEEQRKKKEAERKAQEEERQKKEAEKQKRILERERQQEAERKQREQKLAERKAREEARKQEREQKDSNEKEAKDRKDKETMAKNEKDTKARARKESSSNVAKEVSNISKKRSQPTLPVTPGLSLKATSSGAPSPHVQVATPAVPKAPTPVKPRQNSQQDSHASSPKTPNAIPSSLKPISPRDGSMQHQQPQHLQAHQQQLSQFEVQQQQPQQSQPQHLLTSFKARPPLSSPQLPPNMPPLHHPQPSSPIQLISPPPTTGVQAGMPAGLSSLHAGLNAPLNQGPFMQRTAHQPPLGVNPVPLFPQQAPITSQFRAFPGQGSMSNSHPTMNPYGMIPHNRGFPSDGPPALSPTSQGAGISSMMPGFAITRDTMPSHSRQHSGSLDKAPFDPIPAAPPTQPIARPVPIQRPPSAKSQEGRHDSKGMPLSDMDDLSNHLGSSALLADADETIPIGDLGPRRAASLAAPPKTTGLGFASSPMFPEPAGQRRVESFSRGASGVPGMNWNTPVLPFSSSTALSPAPNWGTPSTASGWSNANAFGMPNTQTRGSISRPVSLRLMVCQACKQLSATDNNSNGFHELRDILSELNTVRPLNNIPAHVDEVMEIFETEGNSHNGGGYFLVKKEGPDCTLVKYEADGKIPPSGITGSAVGEIGSPLPGHSMPAFGGGQRFMPPVGTAPQGF